VADHILWGKLPKARVKGIRNCCVVEGRGEFLALIIGFVGEWSQWFFHNT